MGQQKGSIMLPFLFYNILKLALKLKWPQCRINIKVAVFPNVIFGCISRVEIANVFLVHQVFFINAYQL